MSPEQQARVNPVDLRTQIAEGNPLAPEVERLWCALARIQAFGGRNHPQTGSLCDGAWCAEQAGAALES